MYWFSQGMLVMTLHVTKKSLCKMLLFILYSMDELTGDQVPNSTSQKFIQQVKLPWLGMSFGNCPVGRWMGGSASPTPLWKTFIFLVCTERQKWNSGTPTGLMPREALSTQIIFCTNDFTVLSLMTISTSLCPSLVLPKILINAFNQISKSFCVMECSSPFVVQFWNPYI